MKKRGRPFSEDPRTTQVGIRMTDEEYSELDRLSREDGVNMADYIRKSLGIYDPNRSKKGKR